MIAYLRTRGPFTLEAVMTLFTNRIDLSGSLLDIASRLTLVYPLIHHIEGHYLLLNLTSVKTDTVVPISLYRPSRMGSSHPFPSALQKLQAFITLDLCA
jgi:hypothetical protein